MRKLLVVTVTSGMAMFGAVPIANAQVPEGATGGRSGGPNQSQAVVPEGATGGRSGGPHQSQAVVHKKSHKKTKTHH